MLDVWARIVAFIRTLPPAMWAVILLIGVGAVVAIMLVLGMFGPGTQPPPTATPTLAPATITPSQPSPTSTPAPAPTPTTPPSSGPTPLETGVVQRMAPPTDIAVEDVGQTNFLVIWSYPAVDQVEPTEFHVDVFGQTVGTVAFTGVGQSYEMTVEGLQCGTTHYVQIVAVNGDETASSGSIQADTAPC